MAEYYSAKKFEETGEHPKEAENFSRRKRPVRKKMLWTPTSSTMTSR